MVCCQLDGWYKVDYQSPLAIAHKITVKSISKMDLSWKDEVAIVNVPFLPLDPNELSQHPYCCIGKITGKKEGQLSVGTGFLVSANEVMTVAHNIKGKQYAYTFTLVKDKDDRDKDDNYTVKSYKIIERYQRQNCSQTRMTCDYALLKLDRPVENITQFLEIVPFDFNEPANKREEYFVYGYPLDGSYSSFKMIGSKSQKAIHKLLYSSTLLHHKLSTHSGHSGSPIMIKRTNQRGEDLYRVVAIHKGGNQCQEDPTKNINFARTFTNHYPCNEGDILGNMKRFSRQMKHPSDRQVLADHPLFENIEENPQLTSWDKSTDNFDKFQISQNKVKLKNSRPLAWKQLVSHRLLEMNDAVTISNIHLPKSGSVCVGLIHKDLKKQEHKRQIDGYLPGTTGLMISRKGPNLTALILTNEYAQKQCMIFPETDEITIKLRMKDKDRRQNFHPSLIISTKNGGERTKRQILLDQIRYNRFEISNNYHLYVSMAIPETSAVIRF